MYDYQTLTLTNIDGSISPFPNGASGLILLGTGINTPPAWTSFADAGIATLTDLAGYLPLTGGTLTGALTGTTAAFTGLTLTDAGTGFVKASSGALSVGNITVSDITSGWPTSNNGTGLYITGADNTSATAPRTLVNPSQDGLYVLSFACYGDYGVDNPLTNTTHIGWEKLSPGVVISSEGSTHSKSLITVSTATEGQVLAKTSNGYEFISLGSATVPPINQLQCATAGTTIANDMFLKAGANPSDNPSWDHITASNIYGASNSYPSVLISAGGATSGTSTGNWLPTSTLTTTPQILAALSGSGNGLRFYSPSELGVASVAGLSDGVAKISNGALTSGSVALGGSEVSGTLGVSNGGTGLSSLGSANQVLTSDGSQMVWANKANAAVTADNVAHKLYFTVKNGNTTTAIYFDGSADIDGSDRIPIQRTHAAGVLLGDGTAWTSSATPETIAGVTKQVLVAVDAQTQWNYEFEPLSSVLPAITGLASGSQNAGYILTVGAASNYAPTWIPRTDLNIPSAPSSLPLVDNETGALGTAGTYANADHQHPLPYAVQAAYKFFYPRKIGIGGAVTAEAQEYDGTADLILQVTEIDPHAIINTVPIEKGGTGATTATAALTNLGAAASNHNHDSTYLKLSGGTMTGTINTPANITPLNWVGKSGVATFVSGDLTVQDNVNAFVTGRRLNINLYEATISANVNSPTEIAHVAKQDTTVNIVCGVGATSAYTKYINLPTPTSDMLGDTNQAPAVTGSIFAKCSTDNRIKAFDYSNFSNTPGNIGFKNCVWSSGNVVQFTCINLENNGTTYYWRAVKLVEQSW